MDTGQYIEPIPNEAPREVSRPLVALRLGQLPVAVGVSLLVFSLLALSGPGRIDIVDGQTRYEVARSLVEHGDTLIRDSRVWFLVFPGRDRLPYTTYRLPQSLLGSGAILLADLTGPETESHRRFFFVLTSAAAAALLAVLYLAWFQRQGLTVQASAGWALLGILATPAWFYGTGTFDDILGSAAVVAALVVAHSARARGSAMLYLASGIAVAVAFHCKPPLGVFVLPVLALVPRDRSRAARLGRLAVLATLFLGIVAHFAWDRYKFPPETEALRAPFEAVYVATFPGDTLAGVTSLLLSPGKGLLWYCPAVVLGLVGLCRWWRRDRWLVGALLSAGTVFLGFVGSLVFFSGDPAWGPRYLTPVMALLWLFVPDGARLLGRIATATLLVLSVLVQLLSLAVDPHRLYVQHDLPSAFYASDPWVYFDPQVSHLVQRPREIAEILAVRDGPPAPEFSPAPEPTFAFPVLDTFEKGPQAIERYAVLRTFRPWWIALRALPADQRPVSLVGAVAVFGTLAFVGAGLLASGLRGREAP